MNKADIILHLRDLLQRKLAETQLSIAEIRDARNSNAKSSAGNKHEVSREIIQQELNAREAQLAKTQQMLHQLAQVGQDQSSKQVGFGSLVRTNQGVYFLSIAYGSITMLEGKVFAISLAAPLGQALHGKGVGEEVAFGSQRIIVLEID